MYDYLSTTNNTVEKIISIAMKLSIIREAILREVNFRTFIQETIKHMQTISLIMIL